MIVLITVIILVIVIGIFVISVLSCNNKYKLYNIKIDQVENNIDLLLQKKLDILNRISPIVNKQLKTKDFFEDLKELNIKDYSHFEIYDNLRNSYNELFVKLEDNEKLLKNKSLNKLIDELNDIEDDLIASIKYYNDNVVSYNELIKKFPSNITKILFGYKEKKFYKNEKREVFEI